MAKDCHALRPSAWGARSGENAPPAASDAEAPSTVGPRASRRPPLAVKLLDSVTRRKNHWPLQTPIKGTPIKGEGHRLKPGVIASVEVHMFKSEMIGKERLIKDLEAEIEKLTHQLVETLQIAEERKSYLEKKNKEVQLLERSVEDLEVTVFTLENKVLALENKNAMKEIPAMPSTGKARTCYRRHEYGHQNLLNAQESNEMPEMETFHFEVTEMEIYEKESEKMQLGPAIVTGLLDSMLEEGRWLDLTEHLDHVFRVHSAENEMVAVPYDPGVSSWELRFAHPELYCLPRRQLALELASEGHLDEARVLANDVHAVVVWTSQKSNRWHACHLMGMMLFKGQVLLTSLTKEITRKEIASERMLTCTAIRDYLHVYLPQASGWLQMPQVASYDDYRQLMELVGTKKFRCLLCHQLRMGKNNRLRHLDRCPAVTPCIKARFPRLRQEQVLNWGDYMYLKYQEEEW